jgi:hypothetical protein
MHTYTRRVHHDKWTRRVYLQTTVHRTIVQISIFFQILGPTLLLVLTMINELDVDELAKLMNLRKPL